jgi:antitoxin HicB
MRAKAVKNRHLGSSFDDFLEKEGISAEVDAAAQKRILAWQLAEAMRIQGVSKSEMAERMSTSRAALDRLLDPANSSVTLLTMTRAAAALGARLDVGLSSPRSSSRRTRRKMS